MGWGVKTRGVSEGDSILCAPPLPLPLARADIHYLPPPTQQPPPPPPPSSSWRVIEYFFAVRDWFVVPVAGRTNESGGDGGCWGRVVGGGCSHLSSKRIAMVTRHRRHRLKGLVQRGEGGDPVSQGCPRGLYWILRKFLPAEKIHVAEGVVSRGKRYRLVFLYDFQNFIFLSILRRLDIF